MPCRFQFTFEASMVSFASPELSEYFTPRVRKVESWGSPSIIIIGPRVVSVGAIVSSGVESKIDAPALLVHDMVVAAIVANVITNTAFRQDWNKFTLLMFFMCAWILREKWVKPLYNTILKYQTPMTRCELLYIELQSYEKIQEL